MKKRNVFFTITLSLITVLFFASCDKEKEPERKQYFETLRLEIHCYDGNKDSIYLPKNCYLVDVTISAYNKENLEHVKWIVPDYASRTNLLYVVDEENMKRFLEQCERYFDVETKVESFTIIGKKYPEL